MQLKDSDKHLHILNYSRPPQEQVTLIQCFWGGGGYYTRQNYYKIQIRAIVVTSNDDTTTHDE